jgi:cell division protein FtsB
MVYKIVFGTIVLAFIFIFGMSVGVDKGKQLTEQAKQLSVVSDNQKSEADKIAEMRKPLEAKIRELNKKLNQPLPEDVEGLKTLVLDQKEAIELRDKSILSLNDENKQLRLALENKDKAYRVQLEATKAYQQAIYESKLKYGLGGTILGIAIGFVAGQH